MLPLALGSVFSWILAFFIAATINFITVTPSNNPPTDEKVQECEEKCDGHKDYFKSLKSGTMKCIQIGEIYEASSPCQVECQGYKIEDDQEKCFCDLCKQGKDESMNFCVDLVNGQTDRHDCDKTACNGNGDHKYHGGYCDPHQGRQLDEDME